MAQEERQERVLPLLTRLLRDKVLVVCSTAAESFRSICTVIGGPRERARFEVTTQIHDIPISIRAFVFSFFYFFFLSCFIFFRLFVCLFVCFGFQDIMSRCVQVPDMMSARVDTLRGSSKVKDRSKVSAQLLFLMTRKEKEEKTKRAFTVQ
jgi:hypothetical protein